MYALLNLVGYKQHDGIKHLLAEWTEGIRVANGGVLVTLDPLTGKERELRTPPVKELEATKAMRDSWRQGNKMRNLLMDRKQIYLAYERRVKGHPLSPSAAPMEAMTHDEAIKDLEVLARWG